MSFLPTECFAYVQVFLFLESQCIENCQIGMPKGK